MNECQAWEPSKKLLELHACLASTGEYLATVRVPPDGTVADLCKAVAEQAPIAKGGPCTFYAFLQGCFWRGFQPLAATRLQSQALVEFVRCQPLSILTVAEDGAAKVFNAQTGMCAVTIYSPRCQPPWCCSPDASHSVSFTAGSHAAQVRSLSSGEVVALVGHTGPIKAAVFSLEGFHVGTASADGTAIIWNARTGEILQRFVGHTGEVNSFAFSPDGRHVVTASTDGASRVWSVALGESASILSGHKWSVTCASFSPDGNWIITGSEDRTAKLWHTETGICIREFEGHQCPVVDVLISDSWDSEVSTQLRSQLPPAGAE